MTIAEDAAPESLSRMLKDSLPSLTTEIRPIEGDAGEHLAILVRWYHSSSRDGQWYPLRAGSQLNFTRVSKAVLRMLKDG